MVGRASKELTQGEPKRAREVIGGLAGELSTADMIRARRAYTDYATNAEEDPLPFVEWVRKFYK